MQTNATVSQSNQQISFNDCLFRHQIIPLSAVPSHTDVSCITRYFNTKCPYYIAIHHITNADFPGKYTFLHQHTEAEINIFLSSDTQPLTFELQIGDEVRTHSGSATLVIPPNVNHSANVLSGSGYYIAIRLNEYPSGI